MVYILHSIFRNTVVACLTTVAFTTVTFIPSPLMSANAKIDFATINFGIKAEKLYEKVKKSIERREINKIVGYMFDFKHEVEQYSGKKIDINMYIDQAQKEASTLSR